MTAVSALGVVAACERKLILEGQRFDVRTPLETALPAGEGQVVLAVAGEQNRSDPIRLDAPVANADWTHRGGNVTHLMPHLALSASPQRIWSVSIGAQNARRARITADPVVAAGRIFVMDAETTVSAVSTGGERLWSFDVTPPGERAQSASGGGLAVAGNLLFVTTGFGELLALEAATGTLIWRQRFDAPVTGAPTVADGTVYVAGRDSAGWAVSADNGKLLWVLNGVPSSGGRAGQGGPAIAGRLVIFPFAAGELIAATRDTGAAVWATPVAGQRPGRAASFLSDITGDPVVAGNVTYAGSAGGRMVAMETQTGQVIWRAAEGALGPVWPAGGSLFAVSDAGRLVRLDARTGETIWGVDMPFFVSERLRRQKAIVAHFGPVLAGGRLIVASSDGRLRLFAPEDGAETGLLDLPGGAAVAPVVAGGVLYAVTGNGQLHAFR